MAIIANWRGWKNINYTRNPQFKEQAQGNY
jgi:hypothetical protein